MEFVTSGRKQGPYASGGPDEEFLFNSFHHDNGVDEGAVYRRSLARSQAEAFGSLATRNIMEFPKYNWLQDAVSADGKSGVYKYMTNATLGGAPLGEMFRVGAQEIAHPLYGIWQEATDGLMDAYEQHETTAGGFFILTNMQYAPGADTFVDVALYAYGDRMVNNAYADLLARNWTDHSTVQAPTCCFDDQADGTAGLRHLLVGGMARVIHYQVADVSDAAAPNMTVTHVISYYEGEGQDG